MKFKLPVRRAWDILIAKDIDEILRLRRAFVLSLVWIALLVINMSAISAHSTSTVLEQWAIEVIRTFNTFSAVIFVACHLGDVVGYLKNRYIMRQ